MANSPPGAGLTDGRSRPRGHSPRRRLAGLAFEQGFLCLQRGLRVAALGLWGYAYFSLPRPSLVTCPAIHWTRCPVVILGGMSMTRWPTVAQVDRTTRSAAGCRSRTLAL